MSEECIRVSSEDLRNLVVDVSRALELPTETANLLAESLVSANLRAVDSHGVHLLPHYVKQIRAGNIRVEAKGRVISESGACAVYDGENGIGQVVSSRCCREVVRIAKKYGLGMVVARNSNHFGAAAYWGQQISAAGMIGVVMCNASPSVAPWQGKKGRIGTNPICVAAPSSREGGWLLDMSTTTVALNKIIRASDSSDSSLPIGWALDANGVPTTDTATALKGLLMPLGGYKGSGLGVLVEILCGVLSGGAISTGVGGLFILEHPMMVSQMFLAIDVSRFLSPDEFQERMERLVTEIKSAPSAQGYDEVLVAGDPENRSEMNRKKEGIPLGISLWRNLVRLADELSVELPLNLSGLSGEFRD